MSEALPDELHERITRLCAEADELAEQAQFYEAASLYKQALELLPSIRDRWEAATWIHASIADAYFLAGDFVAALSSLRAVMFCPGALDNAFVRLRRGQVFFEVGEEYQARQELASAYMLAGKAIFADEDPKYADFYPTETSATRWCLTMGSNEQAVACGFLCTPRLISLLPVAGFVNDLVKAI